MRRFALALVLVVALLAGCTASVHEHPFPQQTGAAQTGVALTCARPTRLRIDPLQAAPKIGLRLGPLVFYGFVPGATTAIIPGPPPANLLTKVLIEHGRGTGTVQLTGASCGAGTPLRFCYPRSSPGEDCTTLPSTPQVEIDLASSDYPGYMLFPAPGRYQLSADQAGHTLGTVVVVVRA